MNIKEISIVIPTYNEQKCIEYSIFKIKSFCEKHFKKFEIILVDDGSTDRTILYAKKQFKDLIILKNEKNMGKGYSVKKGMLSAKYDYVLFTDADLSTPIDELLMFDKYILDNDIIIGSRAVKGCNIIVQQNIFRVFMGRTFSLIYNFVLDVNLKDTQCGFKLFKKKDIINIFSKQTIDRFAFDAELMYLARLLNLKIKELGITWINSFNSTVNPFKDSIKMFIEILKIKKRHNRE